MFFAYRTFLPDLTEVEWKSFYEEGKLFARLIGVTPDQIPASLTDFNAWMQATLASNQIIVSPIAQEIGRSLLGMPVRLAAPLNRFLAAGTLPSGVRAADPLGVLPQVGHGAEVARLERVVEGAVGQEDCIEIADGLAR